MKPGSEPRRNAALVMDGPCSPGPVVRPLQAGMLQWAVVGLPGIGGYTRPVTNALYLIPFAAIGMAVGLVQPALAQNFDPHDFALEYEELEAELRARENRRAPAAPVAAQKKHHSPASPLLPLTDQTPDLPAAKQALPGNGPAPARLRSGPTPDPAKQPGPAPEPKATPVRVVSKAATPAARPPAATRTPTNAPAIRPPAAKGPGRANPPATTPQLTPAQIESSARWQRENLSRVFGSEFQPDSLPARRGLSAMHYVVSNENRLDLFFSYIENLKGCYVGVGTDQNFTLAGRARSERVYLMDFDPLVVELNEVHILFLSEAADFPSFMKLWQGDGKIVSEKLTPSHHNSFVRWKNTILVRFRDVKKSSAKFSWTAFHNAAEDYNHLHQLARSGCIVAVPGDLRGTSTLKAIGGHCGKNGKVVRILYLSNAEDYFRSYAPGFVSSVKSLPADDSSVVLRTTSTMRKLSKPDGEKFIRIPFHYNIQTFPSLTGWMGRPGVTLPIMLGPTRPVQKGLSLLTAGPP